MSSADTISPDYVESCNSAKSLLSLVPAELYNKNIEQFNSFVDDSFRKCIECEYTGFVELDGYLLDWNLIQRMYKEMKELFPFVHSVFAAMKTGTRNQYDKVAMSPFMNLDVPTTAPLLMNKMATWRVVSTMLLLTKTTT